MQEPNQYGVPPPALNTRIHCDDLMSGRDETYPNGSDWLRVNAKRFYFTDQQILDAGVKEFPPDDINHYCGVYFLIQHGEIVYVGQSLTIARRISEHLHKPDLVSWIETPRWCREYIEAYYINRMLPELNVKIPGLGRYTALAEQFEAEAAVPLAYLKD